jgi:hypothetical protein
LEQHIKILSVLFIIFGILMLIAAVGIFALGAGTAATILSEEDSNEARVGAAWAGGCITVGAVVCAILAIPNLLTGWGLSKRKGWARIMAIILGVLALPNIPIGTAIGVYALVVMFNDEAKALLNQ